MKHILDLSFQPIDKGHWKPQYSRFRSLARKHGVDIRWLMLDPERPDLNEYLEREIVSASAFFLQTPEFLMGSSHYMDLVLERTTAGIPLICIFDRNFYKQQNRVLSEFGIEGSALGLFADSFADNEAYKVAHPRDIRLSRSEYPGSYRDPHLFGAVNELYLDSTQSIRLHGPAQSLLAFPAGLGKCVDTNCDYFDDWPAPEFTCIAGFFGRGDDHRIVLGINTRLFFNRYTDAFGRVHMGIEGGDNEIFARNLISFVVNNESPQTASMSTLAYQHLENIERNYYDFSRAVLSRISANWWSLVPEVVREACIRKKVTEYSSKFPESAYLDLLDYRKIWKYHWEIFGSKFEKLGWQGGKGKSLKYFHTLNEIRKLTDHPTKRQSTGVELSSDNLNFLDNEVMRSIEMWRFINDPVVV